MKYSIKKVVTTNYEVNAENEEDAVKMFSSERQEQPLNSETSITATEILTTPTLDEFVAILDKAEEELKRAKKNADEKELAVKMKEAKKWGEIVQYLTDKIIPILSKHSSYHKICRIKDNICLWVNEVNSNHYWKISRAKAGSNIEDIYLSHHRELSDCWIRDKYDTTLGHLAYDIKPYIVRNWEILKPSLEKNLIEKMTNDIKGKTEEAATRYQKYIDLDI